MSTIAANNITDRAGTGSPNFPNGLRLNTNAVLGPVTGDAPIFACRAWVNFNGTGTVAIRASGNVSSITDNAVGDYTVNFTTAMPDANYAVCPGVRNNPAPGGGANAHVVVHTSTAPTASAVRVTSGPPSNGAMADYDTVFVSIFR